MIDIEQLANIEELRLEIDRLDAVLSDWRADSELAILNRSGSIRASAESVSAAA